MQLYCRKQGLATLQAWLELVDWTGLGIAPKYPTPRRLKLNMDSTSTIHQWLTLQERQCVVHHHDAAQMFTDFRKELETVAKTITNQESNVVGRVEVMSGGAVLGTALMWRCMLQTSGNGQLEKTGYHNMGGRVSA
jgi:hypothetical protein